MSNDLKNVLRLISYKLQQNEHFACVASNVTNIHLFLLEMGDPLFNNYQNFINTLL